MTIVQSTMDFTMIPMDNGVMDNPLNGGKHPNLVSSPSLLKCQPQLTLPRDHSALNAVTQRKLYDEETGVVAAIKVCPKGLG